MKVFSVIGYTKSGKTTTIEKIIKELRQRNYSVGSVKNIHFEDFKIDTEGTNTDRHRKAGSQLVTARGLFETDILFQEKLDIYKIASFYNHDFLVIEGMRDINAPKIVTADNTDDLDERIDKKTILISGKIADEIDEYKGFKAISALKDIKGMVDYIIENTFELLPDFKENCCNACGHNCSAMCEMIISGEKKRSDCIISDENISLSIDNNEIAMVPFVKNILKNAVIGVVSELKGYKKNAEITVKLGSKKTK
jgi:molybdopterin-guanine dinucleotide biosynthesis protein B